MEILDDVTQMTLAVITNAAFGFPIHAAYGSDRRARHEHEGDGPDGARPRPRRPSYAPITVGDGDGTDAGPAGGHGKKRYELSFTRCMEVVSTRTLAKVLLPAWALRLPVGGLREVGLAFRVRFVF